MNACAEFANANTNKKENSALKTLLLDLRKEAKDVRFDCKIILGLMCKVTGSMLAVNMA